MQDWLPPVQSLRAFVAAVRAGSFLAAGKALGLTHGAISHHVGHIEHLVGFELFRRHRRGAVPTPAAEELAQRISRCLDDLRGALSDARRDSRCKLTVTLTPALAQRWLIPRLQSFQSARPDIDLRIRPTANLVDLDVEGVDVALRYGGGSWPGMKSLFVADEWIFPVASPTYKNGCLPTAPEDLAACVLIQNPRQPWAPWLGAALASATEAHGPSVDDAGLALDLAVRGQGIALARRMLAASDILAGLLVPLLGVAIKDRHSYWLVTRPGLERRDDIAAFADWTRAECASLPPLPGTLNPEIGWAASLAK